MDASTLSDCNANLTIKCESQVTLKENLCFLYTENEYMLLYMMEVWKLRAKHMETMLLFSEAVLKSAKVKIP